MFDENLNLLANGGYTVTQSATVRNEYDANGKVVQMLRYYYHIIWPSS